MDLIFSSIKHFLLSVLSVISGVVLVFSPSNQPPVQLTPSPVQEVRLEEQKASPSASVLGISQEANKDVGPKPTQPPKAASPISTSKPSPKNIDPKPIIPQKKALPMPTITPSPTHSLTPPYSPVASLSPRYVPAKIPLPQPPQVYVPLVNIESLCKGYADELRATTRTVVGVSIYDSDPYFELTAIRLYNYCLANNGNTQGFKVEPPPVQPPLPNPVIVPDSSWQQKTCTDGVRKLIADLERRKQKAIDETTTIAQRECERRGYSPPDYGSCKALIDQRVADLLGSSSYDYMIKDVKLEYRCP